MTVQIALLRAVNVAGHGTVAMATLRTFFAELGFDGAQTLLQSGNVVFAGAGPSDAALERRLKARPRNGSACAPPSSSARQPIGLR